MNEFEGILIYVGIGVVSVLLHLGLTKLNDRLYGKVVITPERAMYHSMISGVNVMPLEDDWFYELIFAFLAWPIWWLIHMINIFTVIEWLFSRRKKSQAPA